MPGGRRSVSIALPMGKYSRKRPSNVFTSSPRRVMRGFRLALHSMCITKFLASRANLSWTMPTGAPAFRIHKSMLPSRTARLAGSDYHVRTLPEEQVAKETARHISEGKIVGWFQGRAEWGPRALGNRSIVVDPRRAEMKNILNERIKHREMFRPFAPSILEEATGEYFVRSDPSPFMTFAYAVRPEKCAQIPSAHARGWHGPPADRQPRGQSALLASHPGIRQPDRCAGGPEHFVQRQRTHRLQAGRSD